MQIATYRLPSRPRRKNRHCTTESERMPSIRQRPQPHKASMQKEGRERENSGRQTGGEQLRPTMKHWPCSENQPAPHRRTRCSQNNSMKILWGRYKSPVVLLSSAVKSCIRMPMSDKDTTCNPHWYNNHMMFVDMFVDITYASTKKWMHWVIPDLIQQTQNWNGSTMGKVTLKHRQLRARTNSQRRVSAAEHHPAEQNSTSKIAGQNPESISPAATDHEILVRTSSRYWAFMKLILKQNEDASQRPS